MDALSNGRIDDAGRYMEKCGEGCVDYLQNTHIPEQEVCGEGAIEILLRLSREVDLGIGRSNFGGGFGGPIRELVKTGNVEKYMNQMVDQAHRAGLNKAWAKAYTPVQGACEVAF